jgi:hypothetical protein
MKRSKLTLKRQTIVALVPARLARVNGGNSYHRVCQDTTELCGGDDEPGDGGYSDLTGVQASRNVC